MTSARDYSIEIRNQKDHYFGNRVLDRHYAKMSSAPAAGEEGTITFRLGLGLLGRGGDTITLTAAEAREIGRIFMGAAGAMPELPQLLKDIYAEFYRVQGQEERAGHSSRHVDDPFLLNLQVFFDPHQIQEAEQKGYVEQISHPVHGPQGVCRLTRAARQEVELRKLP